MGLIKTNSNPKKLQGAGLLTSISFALAGEI